MAASDGRLDALVLDLDTRGGLAIARALGGAGYRLAVGAVLGEASGMRTRHADARVVLPAPAAGLDAATDALVAALEAHPADVVLTTTDPWLAVLHERRDRFVGLTAPAVGAPEAVDVAMSKERTIAVAATLGIAAPRSHPCLTPAEVASAVADLGLPVVLKPTCSWRADDAGGGARLSPLYAGTPAELTEATALLVDGSAPVLVQEVATGRRETHKLFRADGEVRARCVMESARCWPPLGGSSTMRETVAPPPDSHPQAEALLAAVGLDGYAEVEFRRTADGRPLLMEINPRLSQSYDLARRAGVDFARMQLEWARGRPVAPVPSYTIGVRVGWVGGDARYVAGALVSSPPPRPAAGEALRVARDYLTGAGIEGLDRRDVKPLLSAVAFNARGAVRKLAA